MSIEQHIKALKAPYLSEKAVMLSDKNNQFSFKVAQDATKPKIKRAVEKLFGVIVESVRIVTVKPKVKRSRKGFGVRQGWKKAYVKLADGQDIDFTKPV